MFPLQFAVTIGLQYVNSSLSTLANPEDPESESEGWILEKTVKETFTDIMDKMKAVGKGGKVEEGGEAAVATVSWADPSGKNWHHSQEWRVEEGDVWPLFFTDSYHVDATSTRIIGYKHINMDSFQTDCCYLYIKIPSSLFSQNKIHL